MNSDDASKGESTMTMTNEQRRARVQRILQAGINAAPSSEGKSRIEYIQTYTGYAEPGYNDPTSGIIAVGNWNSIGLRYKNYPAKVQPVYGTDTTPGRVGELLKMLGVELEWEDEWTDCQECGKLVRTQPDCHDWTPSYIADDGSLVCHQCIRQDPSDYLESLADNGGLITVDCLDPKEHGYKALPGIKLESREEQQRQRIRKNLIDMGIHKVCFQNGYHGTGKLTPVLIAWIPEDHYEMFDITKLEL
jgi:hypothetical protein